MSKLNLIGLDLETGGLNRYETLPNGERVHGALHYPILEAALIVCDEELNILGKIHVGIFNESMLEKMNPWAVDTHTKSGLISSLRYDSANNKHVPFGAHGDPIAWPSGEHDMVFSNNGHAEQFIIKQLDLMGVKKYDRKEKTGGILFGNSIGFDVSFIDAQMPKLAEYFHYRTIDVSSIDLLKRTAWAQFPFAFLQKEYCHTALSDINETHKELSGYTKNLLEYLA